MTLKVLLVICLLELAGIGWLFTERRITGLPLGGAGPSLHGDLWGRAQQIALFINVKPAMLPADTGNSIGAVG